MSGPAHIKFNCPQCGNRFSVHRNLSGRDARCPCGIAIKIPGPDKIDLTSALDLVNQIPKEQQIQPCSVQSASIPIKKHSNNISLIVFLVVAIVLIYPVLFYLGMQMGYRHAAQMEGEKVFQFATLATYVIYFLLACLVVLAVVYFLYLPVIIAKKRSHSRLDAIRACAIVGGLFIWPAWVVALIWAFSENNSKSDN